MTRSVAIAVVVSALVIIGFGKLTSSVSVSSNVSANVSGRLPLEFSRLDERPHLLMFRSKETPQVVALRHSLAQYAADHFGFVYVSSDQRVFSSAFVSEFDALILHEDELANLPSETRLLIANCPVGVVVRGDEVSRSQLGQRLRELLAVH